MFFTAGIKNLFFSVSLQTAEGEVQADLGFGLVVVSSP